MCIMTHGVRNVKTVLSLCYARYTVRIYVATPITLTGFSMVLPSLSLNYATAGLQIYASSLFTAQISIRRCVDRSIVIVIKQAIE
jgi:hypothetical protein